VANWGNPAMFPIFVAHKLGVCLQPNTRAVARFGANLRRSARSDFPVWFLSVSVLYYCVALHTVAKVRVQPRSCITDCVSTRGPIAVAIGSYATSACTG
jgi:hypothetical protein